MKFSIIYTKLHYGADRQGVENGPDVLQESGLEQILTSNGHEICERTFVAEPKIKQPENPAILNGMKHPSEVFSTCQELFCKSSRAFRKGLIPLVVGGDHSLGLGSVAAAITEKKNTLIIWLDAHADMNTPKTSPTSNIHGMPLAFLMKKEDCPNIDWLDNVPTLDPEKILLIGSRSIDPGEENFILDGNIRRISCSEIQTTGIAPAIDRIRSIIEMPGIENIHLSIDIDAMDPIYVPGTGVPEKNGLTPEEFQQIISCIVKSGKVSSIDFVEFNPVLEIPITLKNSLDAVACF